ncbi:fluoride efflux transporter FluC [Evansella halocellulosilytica]|uniref:fluoride efflux transporter FluC n=1 Tax=Evansella halocellulosilytica TaxID=2011013 RepID=UPI000BB974E1|nr:CrcB family protein [Evansella halocellulosilytica]
MKKEQIFIIIAIFIGGALGTLFRYTINLQTTTLIFPLGTLLENIAGSLLLGILTGYIFLKAINVVIKEAIGVGFCGGFTTMSTLAADSVFLFDEGSIGSVIFYFCGSLTFGLLAAFVGLFLGRKLAEQRLRAGESG